MLESIKTFIELTQLDEAHRYTSWEHCYKAFSINTDNETLALHLAGYLASWGMYRGSSGILQKSYMIHTGAVEIIKNYNFLRCTENFEVQNDAIGEIVELVNKLKAFYKQIPIIKKNKVAEFNPSDTLISKIILGTIGCLPALDRYFIDGVKNNYELCINKLSYNCINNLFQYNNDKENKEAINDSQKCVNEIRNVYYPKMKIIDMHFWQKGFELDKNKNN